MGNFTIMIKQIVVGIIFSFAFTTSAQEWNQDNLETNVVFTIKNFGLNVDGNFNDVKIKTNFKTNQLSKSYINAQIVVKSISTGIESRDDHILKTAYFDEKNYNKIQLKSSKIEKNKDETFSLLAVLTIKGISKNITVPLEILEKEERLQISSNFTINRKDFNMNGGGFVLSNMVKISVKFTGTK